MLSQSLKNFPLRATPLLAYAAGDTFGVFYEFRENKIENVPQNPLFKLTPLFHPHSPLFLSSGE